MRTIKAGFEILDNLNGEEILKKIEMCGRVCYKSEEKITEDSAKKFVSNILNRGHESVIEHVNFSVRFICDRGVSHEIVRHRIASFSQESTRYCNYGNSGEVTFIEPLFFEKYTGAYRNWENGMRSMENHYLGLINGGCSPQEARSVLPNSLKTEIIMTANLREWRHFLKLRTGNGAHPQMREIAIPLLITLKKLIPIVFDDIEVE
jgi:thymidylate synthase, flavin-dependent